MTARHAHSTWQASRWRKVLWLAPVVILLIPAIAMLFTDQVKWGPESFVFMGALLFSICAAFDLAARKTDNIAFRAGVGVAAVTAFLLVWINLAVGIIGGEDNPANLLYVGVVGIAIVGAVLARLKPHAMAFSMLVTAGAQMIVAVVALTLGDTRAAVLTGIFVMLWLIAAWLFRLAAHRQA